MWGDRPSVTIRTEFFKPKKGRYLHPECHRPITHREAARIQSFPDDFVFYGSKTEIAKQIGNAVPVKLASAIAQKVVAALDGEITKPMQDTVHAVYKDWLGETIRIEHYGKTAEKNDPELLRKELIQLFQGFEEYLRNGTLREKVIALIPAFRSLRDLGCSLISANVANSARERIIHYLQKYPNIVIKGDELLVVSGIQEYARRIRELRVQYGWKIYSGVTIKELLQEESANGLEAFAMMKPDEYVLADSNQDRDAAFRWNTANTIRRGHEAVRDKILKYLQANVGQQVSGEELRYVAGNKTEWARRVRELRTEYGWSIVSKQSGRPDLPVGTYVLESLTQLPEHDRVIKDAVRCAVLERDRFQCVECGWNYSKANPSAPRHNLELHHINHHADGGENTEENLITLCNVCHDQKHAKER